VNVEGTINDLWTYEKAGQKVEVRPTGWLNCDNRAVTVEAAIAGHGVIRASDIVVDEQLHTGTLVPVLLDWHMLDTPAISVLYSQTRRENPKVRVFLDFVTEAFQQMQAHTGYSATPSPPSPLPYWHRPKYTHASAVLRAASGKKD
jgi:DNA-binding transcriptional LysR family regulator